MEQKTEASGMNEEEMKRVGTISSWVVAVAVPLIYFLAAPYLFVLCRDLPDVEVLQTSGGILLLPGVVLYNSVEFYETYCNWVIGI